MIPEVYPVFLDFLTAHITRVLTLSSRKAFHRSPIFFPHQMQIREKDVTNNNTAPQSLGLKWRILRCINSKHNWWQCYLKKYDYGSWKDSPQINVLALHVANTDSNPGTAYDSLKHQQEWSLSTEQGVAPSSTAG